MRSKNWVIILLVIIVCVGVIFFVNNSMRTKVSENMESAPIDLKAATNNVSSMVNKYLASDDVNGSFTLNSESRRFAPITTNFSVKNGVLKFSSPSN